MDLFDFDSLFDGSEEFTEEEKQQFAENLRMRSLRLPQSVEEVERMLESMPLTATSLPTESEKTEAFVALEALAAESTLEERVLSYKENGNDAFKLAKRVEEEIKKQRAKVAEMEKKVSLTTAATPSSELNRLQVDIHKEKVHLEKLIQSRRYRYTDSIRLWTLAIEAMQGHIILKPKAEQKADDEKTLDELVSEEVEKFDATSVKSMDASGRSTTDPLFHALLLKTRSVDDCRQLMSSLLCNRCQSQLTLENFRHCIDDARCAVFLWPKQAKAYYRAACVSANQQSSTQNEIIAHFHPDRPTKS